MTYKVLNNITLKNVNNGVISNIATDLLVIPINKKVMASAEFKELDKKSKGYLSKSAKDSLSPSHQSHVITSLDSISAKKILLLKDIDQKNDIYLHSIEKSFQLV